MAKEPLPGAPRHIKMNKRSGSKIELTCETCSDTVEYDTGNVGGKIGADSFVERHRSHIAS